MARNLLLAVAFVALIASACSEDSGDELSSASASPEASPTVTTTLPTSGPTPEATDDPATPTPTREIDMDSPAFTADSTISTVGLDEVFFGMTAEAAAEAAGTAWESTVEPNAECWIATPVNGPDGVGLMIWESTVETIDVTTDLIRTRSGAGVGSSVEELRELFGERLDESDPAQPAFIPADEEDAEFRIFFDVVDGAVVAYRAGRLPMVELAGCG